MFELTESICKLASASEDRERTFCLFEKSPHNNFFHFLHYAAIVLQLEAVLELQAQIEGFSFMRYSNANETREWLDRYYALMLRSFDQLSFADIEFLKNTEVRSLNSAFRAMAAMGSPNSCSPTH